MTDRKLLLRHNVINIVGKVVIFKILIAKKNVLLGNKI